MKTIYLDIKRHYLNARAVINQLRRGEWEFEYRTYSGRCYKATRDGRTLWVVDGPFFCDVDQKNAFGLLFRHWVWWSAARRKYLDALKLEKKIKLY